MATESFETVIVGGGQAGLATGIPPSSGAGPFVILDANARVATRGGSAGTRSAVLAGELRRASRVRFPAKRTSYPTTHEMADYLEAYAAHFELPVGRTAVDTLAKEGAATWSPRRREFEADNVVVATGVMQTPDVPSFAPRARPAYHTAPLGRVPEPLAAPGRGGTRRRRQPLGRGHRLRGRRGARDDPLGRDRSDPGGVDTRRGRMGFRVSPSPGITSSRWTRRSAARCARNPARRRAATPVPAKGLLAAGVERTIPRTVGVRDGGPCWTTGASLDVRNVVWCTGFRRDFSWIDVPFEMGDDGYPVQYRGVVDSAPGALLRRALFLYSFTSMLVCGTVKMRSGSRSTSSRGTARAW